MGQNIKETENREILSTKKIRKIFYFTKKENVEDLFFFSFFTKKINAIELEKSLNYLNQYKKPNFTITGDLLKKDYGFKDGEKLGHALKKLENYWVLNDFILDPQNIKKILN